MEIELTNTEQNDIMLRRIADLENIVRRLKLELDGAKTNAESELLKELLPAIQNFDDALQHVTDTNNNDSIVNGFVMAYSNLTRILYNKGLRKINSIGEKFDYNLHDAISAHSDPWYPDDTVVKEISSGYLYGDVVLKHSQVIVNKHK